MEILDFRKQGAVTENEFMAVMKPWASFSATDINNDNELDVRELKTLIWLIDGKEPLETRVIRDMKAMDGDGSGTIDRLEWIQYLACADPETGGDKFDFDLKRYFDEFDQDNDGLINKDELRNILRDKFKKEILESSHSKAKIAQIMETQTTITMKVLDPDNSGYLDWTMFKRYATLMKDREEGLLRFLK